jgi:hypothetical protein
MKSKILLSLKQNRSVMVAVQGPDCVPPLIPTYIHTYIYTDLVTVTKTSGINGKDREMYPYSRCIICECSFQM